MELWGYPIQDWAVVLQAVSIMATAIFAIKGLRAWRQQLIGKRQIEVAEAALVAAYNAREAMSMIRHPGLLTGEGGSRQREAGESEALSQVRDREFVPLERMRKAHADFVELERVTVFCEALFGSEAASPFKAIIQARHDVWLAANTLLGFNARERDLQGEYVRELRREILQGFGRAGETDMIAKKVTEAVGKIEALCRPYLEADRGNGWWQSLRKRLCNKPKVAPSQG